MEERKWPKKGGRRETERCSISFHASLSFVRGAMTFFFVSFALSLSLSQ